MDLALRMLRGRAKKPRPNESTEVFCKGFFERFKRWSPLELCLPVKLSSDVRTVKQVAVVGVNLADFGNVRVSEST